MSINLSGETRAVILMLLKKILGIEKLFEDLQLKEAVLKKEQEN